MKTVLRFQNQDQMCSFCQLRGQHPDPELHLGNTRIGVVPEYKFLGVIFYRKLSILPHMKALKKKCYKALNLLKTVAHSECGADKKVLLLLYRSLICSKLDYGSIVYGSACKSYLKVIDTIHNRRLHLSIGAFRTSPVNSLFVEANEPSLSHSRLKHSLQYLLKLKANPSNPTHKIVLNPECKNLFARKPNPIPQSGICKEP